MKKLIRWDSAYERVDPTQIDEYFEKEEAFSGTLADLILNNDSTAVFHVDTNRTRTLGDPDDPKMIYMEPLPLAINYHMGSSEGNHKIIVQNIPERKGPWVLFHPPGSKERTFYLQQIVFRNMEPKFEEDVANPLKIKQYYLFRGNPLQVFEDFKKAGFRFKDNAMSDRQYAHLVTLSHKAMSN